MENMKLQQHDGINYVTYVADMGVEEHVELIRCLDIRHDDVLSVGFPRSGNHWAFEVLHMVLNQTTSFAGMSYYQAFIDSIGGDINATLSQRSAPRILPSHKRIYRIPAQAVEKRTKVIYVVRNPKDTLVSLYMLMSNIKDEASVYKGTWDDFFSLQIAGQFPWGSWFDHVLATEKFMQSHPECPVYLHVYEEMKKDPVNKIKELCSFLEVPDGLSEAIASATEFSTMKKSLLAGKIKQETDKFLKKDNIVLRTGIIGDWRNWFTKEQNETFNRQFEEKLANSVFGAMYRQYL